MSKIIEAMEKAKQLRERPAPEQDRERHVRSHSPAPELPQQNPPEPIQIASPRLVAANDYNLPVAEEYRKFKSIIVQLTQGPAPRKTLMVTSAVGGEGKSVTSLNLALSLAQDYDQKVLLIDADLRKPSICRYLGLNRLPGLSDCLLGEASLDEVLVNTGLGNLLLLPAGKEVPNPVEILASQKMKDLLDRLQKLFPGYYLIFDISPVLPFAEARVIGNMVDGIVFVVKEGGTSPRNVGEALDALNRSSILGVVYNKATIAGLSGGYNYYYGEYGYGRRGEEPAAKERESGLLPRLLRRIGITN